MNILMAEHTHYEADCRVGCHHLAEGLVHRGHRVFYISSYLTPLHLLYSITRRSPIVRQRFLNWVSNGKQWSSQFYSYVPFSLLPLTKQPLLDFPWLANHQFQFTFPSLKRKLPHSFDAILIGDPRFLPLLDQVEAPVKIFRLTDDVLSMENTPRSTAELLKVGLPKCTHVFVTAKNLCAILDREFGFKTAIHMPNGVDFNHFMKEGAEPSDLSKIPNPRVIYAGAIDERINVDLLEVCAQKLPAVSFILIGPVLLNVGHLKKYPNIHFLGPRPYREIPFYFASCQAGMIPFRKNKRTDSICSIKLLQYLAAGLPTISTRLLEMESQKAPIFLAKDAEEFTAHVKTALAEIGNRAQYRKFAQQFSWEKNIEQIEKLIRDTSYQPREFLKL